ncbi:hypothetical protein IGI04_034202 [Brassica rapa subsp. trilocularis]|uniref:Uncharacterized protein n=1 Tax=Brassica rapa subsp. trilocularis TaxID=1813537 RepID=A0ABQ7L823_BRACM|nr:hypothetical protein IGI04_034202 [Brassica rapa subsp. trilocularis]
MASEEMKSKEYMSQKMPREVLTLNQIMNSPDYEGTTMFVQKTKKNHHFYSRWADGLELDYVNGEMKTDQLAKGPYKLSSMYI